MVTGPGAPNGGTHQHDPGTSQSDERLEMAFLILALEDSGAEESAAVRAGSVTTRATWLIDSSMGDLGRR